MKKHAAFVAILVTAYAFTAIEAAAEKSEGQPDRADALMRNWRTVTAEALRDPANEGAIQRLRIEAKKAHRTDARVPLLRIGDPEITPLCINEFHTNNVGRGQAAEQLKLSANPGIIVLVGDDLFRNENTETVFVAPEFRERPISVYAGEIIRGIITSSSAFSNSTKEWAAALSRQQSRQREGVRDEMRKWWAENQTVLKAGRFREAKPPANSAFGV